MRRRRSFRSRAVETRNVIINSPHSPLYSAPKRRGAGFFRPIGVEKFIRTRGRALLFAAATMGVAGIAPAAETPTSFPPAAERIFAPALPRLLQIRTLVGGTGTQSSLGSAFFVTSDGLAVTNYHVVAQAALEPRTYKLEYTAADGTHGEVGILAIDLPNDLAVVRIDKRETPFFAFAEPALVRNLAKGERLFSMGNPLDLGFTIVEGTYNGLVERSYNERIHFTGAINPGVSGGPAVNAAGAVVGINVAKRSGSELVSFLVPAHFAVKLLARAQDRNGEPPPDFHAEIARQLSDWQSILYKSIGDKGFRSVILGSYRAPETTAPWFSCWAQTNASVIPKPRASIETTSCASGTGLFVANDLNTGTVLISHSYVRSIDLNQLQFATFLSNQRQSRTVLVAGGAYRKWYTPTRCHEDFMGASAAHDGPPLRVVWCAHAYREFSELYDVTLTAVTEDRGSEALVSRLTLQAVGYDDAIALSSRFLEAIRWSR